jgi:hypothetical protein
MNAPTRISAMIEASRPLSRLSRPSSGASTEREIGSSLSDAVSEPASSVLMM